MPKKETLPAPESANLPVPATVLLTVKQLAEQQPSQSEGGIRWAIFNADDNGLTDSGALVRLGRRVLIDPALYMAWVRTSPRLSPPKPRAARPARSTQKRRDGVSDSRRRGAIQ